MATPVVRFETSPSVLVETEGTVLTFTFQLSEAPPAGGVTVTVNGNAPQILNHFALEGGANIEFTGGDFPMPNNPFTGFDFNITSQTATISMPIFDDDDTDPEFNGVRNFLFTLEPGQGYTVDPSASQDSVILRDTPAPVVENAPPVANDDSGSIAENQIFNGNVIGNDNDPDGDSLIVTGLNGNASIGTPITLDSGAILTLNGNGSYVYNPNGQFNYLIDGQTSGDSFSYAISDGRGGTDTAIVTLTINGVSDATSPPPPPVDLDPAQYGASNPDLIGVIGYNLEALTNHYINFGQAEGRNKDTFDEFSYTASSYVTGDDLITAFGLNGAEATEHYIRYGFAEGRSTTAFVPSRYLLSHDDLLNVFGTNTEAATSHFITNGSQPPENRDPNLFPADRYIASYDDLIPVIRYDLEAGSNHYLFSGLGEDRQVSFDPQAYLNRYTDLQQVFGNDLTAATRHYIENGFAEGRTWI